MDESEVKFSAGTSQPERIDFLLRRINDNYLEPLKFSEDGEINYKKIFRDLTSLFLEISAELTSGEEKDIEKIIDKLAPLMDINLYQSRNLKKSQYQKTEAVMDFNQTTWNMIDKLLFLFRRTLMKLMKTHDLKNKKEKI